MRRWLVPAMAVAAATLFALSPGRLRFGAQPAHAAQTWQVTVGTDTEDGTELTTYLPHNLTINAGDTVNWSFAGFHTVTFNAGQPALPLGRPPLVTNRVGGDGIQPGQQHRRGGAPGPMPPRDGERLAHHILRRLPAIQPALGIPQDGRGVAVEDLAKAILGVLGTHTGSLSPHPA